MYDTVSAMDYHHLPHPHTATPMQGMDATPHTPTSLTAHQLHQLQTLVVTEDSTSSRWTQYQQLWKQHHQQVNGRSGKEGTSPDEKKDEGELWCNVEAQAAFLGPNLWDKTVSYDADLKYVDLDEFLSENGIPVEGMSGPVHQVPMKPLPVSAVPKRERSPSPSEPRSPDSIGPPSPADSTMSMTSSSRDFDPRTRAFSDEELKPQMMVKKSRKQFVPADLKDEKYWARRRKNNMAAKRSRDARRVKENQIALRAGFLEKENMGLRQEMDRLKKENSLLRDKLIKYGDV